MQPKLCSKCKKNIAVVFITKVENGVTMNEGYCIKCARSLGIPQIDQAVKQMGFSDEDLDTLSDEMSNMFDQLDRDDESEDDMDSQTATFPCSTSFLAPVQARPRDRTCPPRARSSPAKRVGRKLPNGEQRSTSSSTPTAWI